MLLGDEINVTMGEAMEQYEQRRQLHFEQIEEMQRRAEARD